MGCLSHDDLGISNHGGGTALLTNQRSGINLNLLRAFGHLSLECYRDYNTQLVALASLGFMMGISPSLDVDLSGVC